ncbi:MAG: CoA-binding protein [Deltaproteobacteria bacterium]|nr:CoA-binding protein [Deltaproteobacteria bacterium]MBW1817653.1 CoA-binding protein [Deltaproteobacteria bacterium]MBW2284413.1 CoA-binding protein [Deltaproteobacteria bacterium]
MSTPSDTCTHPLDILFHPESVAVVGVSENSESQGHMYLRQLLDFPFKGPIYPVSRDAGEVLGVPCHRRLKDIPGRVDHVISCLPHHQVLELVKDCADKGVRSLHLYTARMAETQLAERLDLEKQVIRTAREGGVRVIGPNCMGLYCPESGLTFRFSLPKEAGHVAFASQSGGNAADLEYQGVGRGLRFSKIISFGNAADLNESDFLAYLLEDPQTRIIGLYLEGVKDGGRFLDLLRQSDGRKPVVLFKAGRTRAGARAVVSHTASMSGESAMWEAVCRQFGVVGVHSIQEMADVLLAFQFLRPSSGNRVLVMGGGGGGSVAAADLCELAGFEVPPLPPEMREEIRSFAPDVWSLITNPMDGSVMGGLEILVRAFQTGAKWDGVDLLIGNTSAVWLLDSPQLAARHELSSRFLVDLARESEKPMAIFVNAGDTRTPWRVDAAAKAMDMCREAGVPAYPNARRAVNAMAKVTGYFRRIRQGR